MKSVKSVGIRTGNGLSLRQAQALLSASDPSTTKGLRDRAIIAVLLGCGLRRSEVASLTSRHVQQRVFRPVNRADGVAGESLGEKVVWLMLQQHAAAIGVPGIAPHDLRRTCAENVPRRGRRP